MIITGIKVFKRGQPGCPVVTVSGRDVTVQWIPPYADVGSQVLQYVVYRGSADMDKKSLPLPKIAGRSRSCTFSTRLKFNTMCKFAVAAKTTSGVGPISEFSECVKIPDASGTTNLRLNISFKKKTNFNIFQAQYSE